ncbi:hypothetical protein FA09DRAFT_249022 [Tilletiopsis washingtonensis]|uniref:Uncharacterized protein n=1 Tax=Tilletiopsis washingtonensis TaxID=58919 RepID=A0A316ZCE1_9BASI|nr:hypothetical protein FA09DRAFT_249022 [Tilletiopsis washingtonensis]PWN98708.1 hypothetical protein FA09DRAFT_249022 [Tilletiopsis washingtonensis]
MLLHATDSTAPLDAFSLFSHRRPSLCAPLLRSLSLSLSARSPCHVPECGALLHGDAHARLARQGKEGVREGKDVLPQRLERRGGEIDEADVLHGVQQLCQCRRLVCGEGGVVDAGPGGGHDGGGAEERAGPAAAVSDGRRVQVWARRARHPLPGRRGAPCAAASRTRCSVRRRVRGQLGAP